MGTIRYTLRKDKPLKNGTAPVELVYQVKGQRKYYRTDKKLFPENWDPEKQVAIISLAILSRFKPYEV